MYEREETQNYLQIIIILRVFLYMAVEEKWATFLDTYLLDIFFKLIFFCNSIPDDSLRPKHFVYL
jgi:hypothetical protein